MTIVATVRSRPGTQLPGGQVLECLLAVNKYYSPARDGYGPEDDWWLRSPDYHESLTTVICEAPYDSEPVNEAIHRFAKEFYRWPTPTANPMTVWPLTIGGRHLRLFQSVTTVTSLPLFVDALSHLHSASWFVYQKVHSRRVRFPRPLPLYLGISVNDWPLLLLSQGDIRNYFSPTDFQGTYGDRPLGKHGLAFREAHPEIRVGNLPAAYVAHFLRGWGLPTGCGMLTDSLCTALAHNLTLLCEWPGESGLSSVHLCHDMNDPMNQACAVDAAGNVIIVSQQAARDVLDIFLGAWTIPLTGPAQPVGAGLCVGEDQFLRLEKLIAKENTAAEWLWQPDGSRQVTRDHSPDVGFP